jgi:transcriptional regulator with XRE-family HTH domain
MTRHELSLLSGIGTSTIENYERGKISEPSIYKVEKLLNTMGYDLAQNYHRAGAFLVQGPRKIYGFYGSITVDDSAALQNVTNRIDAADKIRAPRVTVY